MEISKTNFEEFDNHAALHFMEDVKAGVVSFVAIHNNSLGPALGGTRIFPYLSRDEAIKDVLKLSRAMTYKCAIAGLPFGGGKGVVIADPTKKDIFNILEQHALHVKKLGGIFYTGADVGLNQEGVEHMAIFCPYIIGTTQAAGDPSPFAGLSAFLSARVALKQVFGNADMKRKTVIIKGIGKTGKKLAELWYDQGARVLVTDIDPDQVKKFIASHPRARAIPVSEANTTPCDVYAPCALSNDITEQNAKHIKASIICGTANNQLSSPNIAQYLFDSGIIHVPDYIANAGGLINVADELMPGGYQPERVKTNLEKLQETLREVLTKAARLRSNPWSEANKKVEERLNSIKAKTKAALYSI